MSMRVSKVVTKSGDKGSTGLIGGQRVLKCSLRVHAYGDVDELNSCLGLALAHLKDPGCQEILIEIQHRLFTLGADLASPEEVQVPRITPELVAWLDAVIEELIGELPPLEEFILPGGGPAGAALHLARTVARRAERHAVALHEETPINSQAIIYLNRLSDLLFILARITNKRENSPETLAEFSRRKTRHSAPRPSPKPLP